MREVTVIIPNLNGMSYLGGCLSSLQDQSLGEFDIILVDNGSTDGSVEYVREQFPQVKIRRFRKNTGFCHAVNTGIRMSHTPYVILLNNDTVCDRHFVRELLEAIRRHPRRFSCAAKMVQMKQPGMLDDGGDYYCALGWAFAWGKGKPVFSCSRERKIFAACAGAAIYRREALERTGLFDERHFAYLEDIDLGYRARILGYENWFVPGAVVYHLGSATSGSAYNEFKVSLASRNSVYLIWKNMPTPQILLNSPFLLAGFLIKGAFFVRRGFGRQYGAGLVKGLRYCRGENRVVFQRKNLKHYIRIQMELWYNVIRRLADALPSR